MGSHSALKFMLLFSTTLSSSCDGGKVLIYPVDGSHWLNMKILVEAFHSQDHQITVLRSSTSWYISETSPHYTSITVAQEQSQNIESQDLMSVSLKRSLQIHQNKGSIWAFLEFYWNLFSMVRDNHQTVANLVITVFENKALIQELRKTGYDLFLADPSFPGGVLLAHYLRLPLVFNVRWLFNGEAHFSIAPSPLSYIPEFAPEYSDKMDMFQRFNNIIYHVSDKFMRHKGAPHLRTKSYQWPWYAYHSLNVIAVLGAFGFLIIASIWMSCRYFIRRFMGIRKSTFKSKGE
uniref:Uncharacterized protein n=1 Tax=Echeneis naucrates TaxID=173247 RepID=A0A665TJ62_ECHNA